MHVSQIEGLDPTKLYWVPAVVAPQRDWSAAPGCRRGARFMVDRRTLSVSREVFGPFESKAGCLDWIMRHRSRLTQQLPEAPVRAVQLDRWLLGLE